jgi:pimeloyl-ACP methyl ester carboxylesterase
MHTVRAIAATIFAAIAVQSGAQQIQAPTKSPVGAATHRFPKPTIVLVHGAFADASGWLDLIPLLQRDGYKVVTAQNPLASLAGDVEWTKRVIDAQHGPVVVVGHSYGGAVITGAATGNANVKALVYIAAFGPEVGEPVGAYLDKYPTALGASLVPDAAGFMYIDVAKYHDIFTGDLPQRQTDAMAVTQKPINGKIFGQSGTTAAWKTIPSWYMVATDDHALNPNLERFYAKRMHAHTVEIKSSHVAFISHPQAVADLIVAAATASATTAR